MKRALVTGLMLMSVAAMAGDKGNGGGSHFCKSKKTQEMYDIYEGATRYDLSYPQMQNGVIEDYISAAIEKISKKNLSLAAGIQAELDYLKKPNNFGIKKDLELTPIPDANILMKNKGCEYKQLANWDDVTGKVFVDKEIYDSLPEFHKAALKLHEAIYSYARKNLNHDNSDLTRRFNAEVLSLSEEMETLKKFTKAQDFAYSDEIMSNDLHITEGEVRYGFQVKENLLAINLHEAKLSDLKDYKLQVEIKVKEAEEFVKKIAEADAQIKKLQAGMNNYSRRERNKAQKEIDSLNTSKIYYNSVLEYFVGNGSKREEFSLADEVYYDTELAHMTRSAYVSQLGGKPFTLEVTTRLVLKGNVLAVESKTLQAAIKTEKFGVDYSIASLKLVFKKSSN